MTSSLKSAMRGCGVPESSQVFVVDDAPTAEVLEAAADAGAEVISSQAAEELQQMVEATKPVERQTYALTSPRSRMLAAMAGMVAVAGVDAGQPRGSRSIVTSFDRAAMERHFDGSAKAQADKIARAKAKRERRAAKRRRVPDTEESHG